MPMRTVPLWATFGLLLLAALTVGFTLKAKERPQTIVSFDEPSTSISYEDDRVFTITYPENWRYTEQAESDIQELGRGQYLQFSVIDDPSQEGVSYFSTAAFDEDTEEVTLSIYRYHTLSFDYERLYQATYAQGEHRSLHRKAWPVWHVVGYDDKSLVILLRDGDDEMTDCADPILYGLSGSEDNTAELLSLNLADPSMGLSPYSPDRDVIRAAEDAQEVCEENLPI